MSETVKPPSAPVITPGTPQSTKPTAPATTAVGGVGTSGAQRSAAPTPSGSLPSSSTPTSQPSLTNAVRAATASRIPIPKGLSVFNTSELAGAGSYIHGLVYGETSARKSTTAALFGTPENTRIVLTRRKEQLIPLQDLGYTAACVEDSEALSFALMYPEKLWPDWAAREDRVFVLDDATEAVAMLVEGAVNPATGEAFKDRRKSYTEAGSDLRDMLKNSLSKPQHFIMTALARVRENPITNEERIGPDLPPSMLQMLTTEMEFVFYINKRNWQFVTADDAIQFKDTDEQGKEKLYRREIFAKNKMSLAMAKRTPPLIAKYEPMDLRGIWERVVRATAAAVAGQGTPGK